MSLTVLMTSVCLTNLVLCIKQIKAVDAERMNHRSTMQGSVARDRRADLVLGGAVFVQRVRHGGGPAGPGLDKTIDVQRTAPFLRLVVCPLSNLVALRIPSGRR